jgi:hypothetical protein
MQSFVHIDYYLVGDLNFYTQVISDCQAHIRESFTYDYLSF